MKEKISGLLNWGVGTFQIIMKNKLVSIGCFLFTGILHVANPRGGLRWTAGLLSIVVALYALLSLIFILTDKNEKVGKGKDAAGDLVKGVLEGNKDPILHGQTLIPKNQVLDERSKQTRSRLDDRMQALSEKQKKEPKAGKVVMCVFYSILLAASVILFFWSDVTIAAAHIIVGIVLIADSIIGIASTVTAVENNIPLKYKTLSVVLYIITAVIGVTYIFLTWGTADMAMVLCGIVLIAKAVAEFVIMIRNREVVASAKGTINEIKQQTNQTGNQNDSK